MHHKTTKHLTVVLGDIHGDWSVITHFAEQHPDSLIIQVGDFGIGFKHPIEEEHKLDKLAKKLSEAKCELFVIRGNHDDPSYFDNTCTGGAVTLLADYSTMELIDGRSVQLIGGGISVDRSERIPGKSWWSGEGVIFHPDSIKPVDILVTHVCPTVFPLQKAECNPMLQHFSNLEIMQGHDLFADLLAERKVLQEISDLSKCKRHYFGHFHRSTFFLDSTSKREYICIDINEFRQI